MQAYQIIGVGMSSLANLLPEGEGTQLSPLPEDRRLSRVKKQTKGQELRFQTVNGHYGIDFINSHSDEDVQEVIKALAKRNRMAREEALRNQSMEKLQRQLKTSLNTAFGKAIEAEMNRRFRQLYKVRMKG